jgi:acetyl-CoA carboxylase beta subunit
MGSAGVALAAAGLALVLVAGHAAAAIAVVTEPTITGITASCGSDDSYTVSGTVTVLYPSGYWYDE